MGNKTSGCCLCQQVCGCGTHVLCVMQCLSLSLCETNLTHSGLRSHAQPLSVRGVCVCVRCSYRNTGCNYWRITAHTHPLGWFELEGFRKALHFSGLSVFLYKVYVYGFTWLSFRDKLVLKLAKFDETSHIHLKKKKKTVCSPLKYTYRVHFHNYFLTQTQFVMSN